MERSIAELCFHKIYKMAIHAANYMTFLEFLTLTNTSRRRKVKERVDACTKIKWQRVLCTARFCLSKLTVTIRCWTYVRQFICRPYTISILRKYEKFTSLQLRMTLQGVLQTRPRPTACRPAPAWSTQPFSLCQKLFTATASDTGCPAIH